MSIEIAMEIQCAARRLFSHWPGHLRIKREFAPHLVTLLKCNERGDPVGPGLFFDSKMKNLMGYGRYGPWNHSWSENCLNGLSTILVAVDGSKYRLNKAFKVAAGLARSFTSKLHAICVVDLPTMIDSLIRMAANTSIHT